MNTELLDRIAKHNEVRAQLQAEHTTAALAFKRGSTEWYELILKQTQQMCVLLIEQAGERNAAEVMELDHQAHSARETLAYAQHNDGRLQQMLAAILRGDMPEATEAWMDGLRNEHELRPFLRVIDRSHARKRADRIDRENAVLRKRNRDALELGEQFARQKAAAEAEAERWRDHHPALATVVQLADEVARLRAEVARLTAPPETTQPEATEEPQPEPA